MNYPDMMQSEWENAPFNREEDLIENIDVTISQTLSRNLSIYGYKNDEPKNLYHSEYYTPEEIIKECQSIVKYILKNNYDNNKFKNKKYLMKLCDSCYNWNVDETEIIKE